MCIFTYGCVYVSTKVVNLQREAIIISVFLYNSLTSVPDIEKEWGRDL